MQIVAEGGTYYSHNSFAVPFKHFNNAKLWNVEVGNENRLINLRTVAGSAEEAAHIALSRFETEFPDNQQEEDDELLEVGEELINE